MSTVVSAYLAQNSDAANGCASATDHCAVFGGHIARRQSVYRLRTHGAYVGFAFLCNDRSDRSGCTKMALQCRRTEWSRCWWIVADGGALAIGHHRHRRSHIDHRVFRHRGSPYPARTARKCSTHFVARTAESNGERLWPDDWDWSRNFWCGC